MMVLNVRLLLYPEVPALSSSILSPACLLVLLLCYSTLKCLSLCTLQPPFHLTLFYMLKCLHKFSTVTLVSAWLFLKNTFPLYFSWVQNLVGERSSNIFFVTFRPFHSTIMHCSLILLCVKHPSWLFLCILVHIIYQLPENSHLAMF